MQTSLMLWFVVVADAFCGAQRYGGVSYYNSRSRMCLTPQRKEGECVPVENCPPLYALLTQGPRDEAFKKLRESNCGFQGKSPKVCCPSQTSGGDDGNGNDDGTRVTVAPTRNTDQPNSDLRAHPALRLLPSPTECGKSYSARIHGGEVTDLGEYPWTVMLQYQNLRTRRTVSLCGGALINKRYVVTAAHCIYGDPRNYRLVSVVVGEHNTETDPDCKEDSNKQDCAAPKQTIGIAQSIMHPDYNPTSKEQFNDIGLIRLDRDIVFQGYLLNPICFPRDELLTKSYVGERTVVAGWGKTENSSGSTIKLDVKLKVVTNEQCAQVYQQQRVVGDKQICAGGEQGKDSCRGDSGGPLMVADGLERVANSDGRFYLLGVVSYGPDPCGRAGWPGVYTLIPKYTSWILDQLKE